MKFSKYNLVVKVDHGLVIYNSKNAAYVNIFNEPDLSNIQNLLKTDYINPNNKLVKELYKRGYIVDNDVDEYQEVYNFIQNYYKDNMNSFRLMVYVTERCNFRCIYCPQKHEAATLSHKKWEALYTYIEKNIKNGNYENIMIEFFGGEPLLRKNQIIEFLTKIQMLKETHSSIKIFYKITTNGYLLTPALYDILTDLGVCYYQITLDGIAETHDKMRPLANGNPTWNTIVKNLKHINTKNDNVKIIIRTNYNSINQDKLDEFYKWSISTFNNEKFIFDVCRVARFSDNVDEDLIGDSSKQLENKSIIKKYKKNHKNKKEYLAKLGQACSCAENYFIISAKGELSKCEQMYDDIIPIGHLSDKGDFVFYNNLSDYIENYEFEKCKTCFIYPLCAARSCPAKKAFNQKERPDCCANYENVKDNIIKLIKSGYLDKRHETKS